MFPALARHWVQRQVKVAMSVMSMPCAPGGGGEVDRLEGPTFEIRENVDV